MHTNRVSNTNFNPKQKDCIQNIHYIFIELICYTLHNSLNINHVSVNSYWKCISIELVGYWDIEIQSIQFDL